MRKALSFILCFIFIFGLSINSFAVIGSSKGVPEDQEIPFFVNGGRYYIVNAHSNKLLNVANFGTTSNTNVVQWWNNGGTNNEWIITLLSDGYYKISPCHTSNMALDVLNNGTANGDKKFFIIFFFLFKFIRNSCGKVVVFILSSLPVGYLRIMLRLKSQNGMIQTVRWEEFYVFLSL